jgi:hypothetical protein
MSQFTNEVLGPLTDAELRATPVPVSGTVTANAGTGPFPVSDNGGSLTVDGSVTVNATDLDIRDLTHVSDSVKIGDGTDLLAVNNDGSINVSFSTAAVTPTVSRVSVSTAATTLLAADSNRKRVILFNEAGTLYVKIGTGASSTDYSYRLTANTYLEIGFAQSAAITAIKASGTSDVQVTALS